MKHLMNWRQAALYALLCGSIWGFFIAADESGETANEVLINSLMGIAIMFACGWPLCKLTKKWRKEGKVEI